MAQRLGNHVLLHHHTEMGLVYAYPRIQYKIIGGLGKIIGLAEGVEVLGKIKPMEALQLGNDFIRVEEIELEKKAVMIGLENDQNWYYFITPWLALNDKNYQDYMRSGDNIKKRKMLEKILIGNMMSLSKSLGFTVPDNIYVEIKGLQEKNVELKEMPMLGFMGSFRSNFVIPDYWGLGKSVSRGFGTIRKGNVTTWKILQQ
jgi:hypothetical protein